MKGKERKKALLAVLNTTYWEKNCTLFLKFVLSVKSRLKNISQPPDARQLPEPGIEPGTFRSSV